MGYFSNGTHGDAFESQWCARCVHNDEDKGCPVMLAHVLFAYELCNEKKHPGNVMLDMLITEGPKGQRCAMFHRGSSKQARKHEQLEARLAELKKEAAR